MYIQRIIAVCVYTVCVLTVCVVVNVAWQMLPRRKTEPPMVFHWLPFIGNAMSYGLDPCQFYMRCREKHGDVFTFVLLGRKMTVYLGLEGNDFILNGRLQDVNAEEIYSPLTTPVFGRDVIYDCPNSKLMEQKKFVKFGLTQRALESHVRLIEQEVIDYIASAPGFDPSQNSGIINIAKTMAEITIFTASRSLQGAEVRSKMTTEFAALYNDLDHGFRPINFLIPWAPLPQNRRRDTAHRKMQAVYMQLIQKRRALGMSDDVADDGQEPDMIWNLMRCTYKNGTPLPDAEIANLMITLLMAGQHSSSASSAWIMLRLASRPDIAEELYEEQKRAVGDGPLTYQDLENLPLMQNVVKETLRVHSSIHSIMRKVKNPMPVPNTDYVVTPDKVLLASPIVTHMTEEFFPDATTWNPHRWDHLEDPDAKSNDTIDYGYGLVSKGSRSPYLPFGAGRHRCIGEKFAYINLGTIISTLVRNFKFSTLDGSDHVPSTDYASLFSRPLESTDIKWERR